MTAIDEQGSFRISALLGCLLLSETDPDEVLVRIVLCLAESNKPADAVQLANLLVYAVIDGEGGDGPNKKLILSAIRRHLPEGSPSAVSKGIASAEISNANRIDLNDEMKDGLEAQAFELWEAEAVDNDEIANADLYEWAEEKGPSHPAYNLLQRAKHYEEMFDTALTLPLHAIRNGDETVIREFGSSKDMSLEDVKNAAFGMLSSDQIVSLITDRRA